MGRDEGQDRGPLNVAAGSTARTQRPGSPADLSDDQYLLLANCLELASGTLPGSSGVLR